MQDTPALNFSNSYSFNEKIRFIKTKSSKASVLALGSSMTLNNLHSGEIISRFQGVEYLNTASWGMSVGDSFKFLKFLGARFNIKYLIISSSIIDFKQPGKEIDFDFIDKYLRYDGYQLFIESLKKFDLRYYVDNWSYAKKVRSYVNDYEYLVFDDYGAVSFPSDGFRINEERWMDDYLSTPGLYAEYAYLDSISDYCKANDIELLFFESPYREGLFSNFDDSKSKIYTKHLRKVDQIIKSNGQLFVDAGEKNWPDSLFSDAIHLNALGSELFTEFCLDKVNQKRESDHAMQ